MANEGVIKVQYALAGEADITVKILKPDDTVRDSQTAEALSDSGHANIYSNSGAITIQPGDTVAAYDGAVNIGGGVYRPDTSTVALKTTVASVDTADTVFRLTAGPSDNDALKDMVVSILDITGAETRSRRISGYVGSTKQVTVERDFNFAIAAGDIVRVWANASEGTLGTVGANAVRDAVWNAVDASYKAQGTKGQRLHHAGKSRY